MAIKRTGSLDQALNRLVSSKGSHVRVGILDNSTGLDGVSLASKAFWNEYGTKTIPARPFFRDTIKNQKAEWIALTVGTIKSGYSIEFALRRTGERMMTDIVNTATQWTTPPNAAYTEAKKGFNKPLTDTGMMIAAIKSEYMDEPL